MTAPMLSESDLGALYGNYYPRKQASVADIRREAQKAVSRFARLRRWWMGTSNQGQYLVQRGESILDIGCGAGLSMMEAKAFGARVFGVEADPNVRRLANALGLDIHIGSLMDVPFPGEKFDLVVLNQVIEHVPAPDRLLLQLHQRLRPGGRIVLVFPNIRSVWCRLFGIRWINWHIPYHLHHFSRSRFVRMAERCGYRVRRAQSITPNLWTFLQFRTLAYAPQRGIPSPFWRYSQNEVEPSNDHLQKFPLQAGVVRLALRAVYLVLMLPIGLVNRIVDLFGFGDSLMVEIVPQENV